jgi:DNA processing protein
VSARLADARQGALDLAGRRRTGIALTDAQRRDWLRLIRTEGIGPRTFRQLVNRFGGAAAALDALPALARDRLGRAVKPAAAEAIDAELDAARRMGARFVALGEPDYPALLAEIADPPPVLALLGRADIAAVASVAIVGSRNASALGLKMAERLAEGLGRAGYAIVSGLARGIDAAAHRASLDTGAIAVLAGGLDRLYPPEHGELFAAIAARGLLVSEMPFGWQPRGRDFPRRNRIVAGLALGTVVVEAARQSGSLITARFALQQDRQVFAVPGGPLDPRAEGPNHLIREGAVLTRGTDDVIEVLAPMLAVDRVPPDRMEEEPRPASAIPLWDELDLFGDGAAVPSAPVEAAFEEPARQPAPSPPGDLRQRIAELLSHAPCAVDDLVLRADAPARQVHAALTAMELDGDIVRPAAGSVALAAVPSPDAPLSQRSGIVP